MYDPQRQFTLEEYWRMVETFPDRRFEYVDGHIRNMTGGSPAHAQIGNNLGVYLFLGLERAQNDCNVYNSDITVKLSQQRLYCPDLAISCDPADWTQKKALQAPTLVAEILSPSTERIDRHEKLQAYQSFPTIQEILFVDSRRRHVEHYHRLPGVDWKHDLYTQEDQVMQLKSLDITLSLKQIYHKAYLDLETFS